MRKKLKICITALFLGFIISICAIYLIAFTAPSAPDHGQAPQADQKNLAAEIRLGTDQQYYYLNTAHHAYQRVLQAVVNQDGSVNYDLLADHRSDLDLYIHTAAYLDPNRFKEWSKKRQIAFWINIYNALTLQIVSEHYPIGRSMFGWTQNILGHNIPSGSIRNLPFMWKNTEFTVLNAPHTLDHIEHKILRPNYGEPRIHMAINCASIGCPPLRNEVYSEHTLQEQLEDQTRLFLIHYTPSKVIIDKAKHTVSLSSILGWFGSDFIEQNKTPPQTFMSAQSDSERAVLVFISRYLPTADANYLRDQTYTIQYRPYDWSLNTTNQNASTSP